MSREALTRRAPPKMPLHPDAALVRDALTYLTRLPEWQTFIDHYKAKEVETWWKNGAPDAGAFLRLDGRRSLLNELEALPKRLTDDGHSDHE